MQDPIFPAQPGTYLLELADDEDFIHRHVIIGWAHTHGSMVHPLTYANVTGRAVLFPDGCVMDRQFRRSFADLKAWQTAVETAPPAAPPTPVSPDGDPSLGDIGLSTRAVNVLKLHFNADLLSDLTRVSRAHVEAVRGVSAQTLLQLNDQLARRGWTWAENGVARPAVPAPETDTEPDDIDAWL